MILSKRLEILTLAGFLLLVWAAYSFYIYGLPARYNSPDEMANAFFTSRLASGQPMSLSLGEYHGVSTDIIHPRSTKVVNNQILPTSFLGLPLLFGWLGKFVGIGAVPYLTPLFGALALLALYYFTKEIFDNRTAWVFIILTSILPAFWYYHARPFFHNALFVDLLAILLWLSLKSIKDGRWFYYLLTGLFFGLAVVVRSSELPWLLAASIIILIWYRKKIKFTHLFLSLIGIILAGWPVLVTNRYWYGSYFYSGYQADAVVSDAGTFITFIKGILLPFGFDIQNIYLSAYNYLFNLQWWWLVMVLMGAVLLFKSWRAVPDLARGYLIAGLLVSVWLIVYYGSWLFYDNTNFLTTLGTSYIRYWLPLLVFGLWPVSWLLAKWWSRRWGKIVTVIIIFSFFFFSYQLVVFESQEGLRAVSKNIKKFAAVSLQVQAITPNNSVIVSGITDKFFFPERQVIVELSTEHDFETLVQLLKQNIQVYNYRQVMTADNLIIEQGRLNKYNLTLNSAGLTIDDYALYEYKLLTL